MTVTGPPLAICSWKMGTTLPAEPRTLPKRTVMKRVLLLWAEGLDEQLRHAFRDAHDRGGIDRLVGGDHHESVHLPVVCQSWRAVLVPRTLFLTASPGFHSIIGTCLWAAAWKTSAGRKLAKMVSMRIVVTNVGDAGNERRFGKRLHQAPVNVEQIVFGPLDQDENARFQAADDPAQFRTDAAAGPRDHDRLVSAKSR